MPWRSSIRVRAGQPRLPGPRPRPEAPDGRGPERSDHGPVLDLPVRSCPPRGGATPLRRHLSRLRPAPIRPARRRRRGGRERRRVGPNGRRSGGPARRPSPASDGPLASAGIAVDGARPGARAALSAAIGLAGARPDRTPTLSRFLLALSPAAPSRRPSSPRRRSSSPCCRRRGPAPRTARRPANPPVAERAFPASREPTDWPTTNPSTRPKERRRLRRRG